MHIAINIVYNILINQLTEQSVTDETFSITFLVIEYSCHVFVERLVVKADCY